MLATRPLSQASVAAGPRCSSIDAEQRQVVRVRARARAHLALVLRVGQFLVGVDVVLRCTLSLVVDDRRGRGSRSRTTASPGRRPCRAAWPGMRASSSLLLRPAGTSRRLRRATGGPHRPAGSRRPGWPCLRVFSRARMPASSASTRLILMPVALVKFVVERLVGLVVARRVEVRASAAAPRTAPGRQGADAAASETCGQAEHAWKLQAGGCSQSDQSIKCESFAFVEIDASCRAGGT